MNTPIVRKAIDQAARAAIFSLRYDLYVEQQGLFGDTADHAGRQLRDASDDHAQLWVVEDGQGTAIGSCRICFGNEARFDHEVRETFDIDAFSSIVDEADIAVASRFVIAPEHRQSSVPLLLIRNLIEDLIERGTELLLAECEPHLLNMWARLGFRPFGLVEHPINGTLVRIAFVFGDLDHLRKIGSPMLSFAQRRTRSGYAPRRLAARLSSSSRVVSEANDREQFWAKVEETVPLDHFAERLGGLAPDEFDALLGNGHALDCAPGSLLIRRGHASRTLYVLLTGSLEVCEGERRIAEVHEPGSVLGEVAFFANTLRMSDVKAGPDGARVLALSERNIKQLIDTRGAGAAKFLLALTRGLCRKLHDRAA